MIRINRIFDQTTDAERRKLAEVQAIFRKAFPSVLDYAAQLPELVLRKRGPGHDIVLLTAEDGRDRVHGFALVHYYPDIQYAYLDYIASDPDRRDSGLGGALYEAVREYLARRGAKGLFMDVPPDDPGRVRDPAHLPNNRNRLRFYERYGAVPVTGTAYDTLPPPGYTYDLPYLVYDPLGRNGHLSRTDARQAVHAILTRKYRMNPDTPYVQEVVASIREDPVRLRAARYANGDLSPRPEHGRLRPVKLLVTARHDIHHVRERGYVERPARIDAILKGLGDLSMERRAVRHHDDRPIRAVHDPDFVNYLAAVCKNIPPGQAVYPYVFPIRRPERKPKDKTVRAGYYCIDTFTPLSETAYRAARAAADCAISGADLILHGDQLVYALCRPPGHHAERRVYGGFCYFNNAAIAAHRLSEKGKVALLDIDFHHGNGSQDIFYRRDDVLVVSIHGHPNHAYPYFSGFADETGEGRGLGFNRNYPLPEGVDDARYLEVLGQAIKDIRNFKPTWLVVSLGLDIMRGDPTGSFTVGPQGMKRIGETLGKLGLPTLVVQEGGYSLRNLVRGPRAFFLGLSTAWY
jgi:acetoin utilization deacetylase AcuC-like enzyme/GNAT superfamily N-acetyltransferase